MGKIQNIKEEFDSIDIAKFIACVLVVGIHTRALSTVLRDNYYFWDACIGKLAVPFFFVTSGFFLQKKLEKEKRKKAVIKSQLYRLGIPLLFWESCNIFILLPQMLLEKGYRDGIFYILKSILFYPFGAMWYVQALIVAIPVVVWLDTKNGLKLCVLFSMFLYFIALLGNNYYFLIYGTKYQTVMDFYMKMFLSTRNGVFVALFFVSSGAWIAKNREKIERIPYKKLLFGIVYVCFILETIFLRNKKSVDDGALYLSFVILIPLLFIVIEQLKIRCHIAKRLRNYSTGIYFMHRAILLIVEIVLGNMIEPLVKFLLVFIIAFILCSLGYKLNNKKMNMLIS